MDQIDEQKTHLRTKLTNKRHVGEPNSLIKDAFMYVFINIFKDCCDNTTCT